MVVFPRFGYEPCSSVLYSLEFCKKVVGNAVQQAVSVVKARRNVRMNYDFCCFPMEKVSDFSNTMDIKYATRQMCCTWLFMLRVSPKKTPMFLATVDTGTTVSPSSMCGIESLVYICGAHITIISVFLQLNFSLFIFIQSCNSATQFWMRVTAWIVSSSECGLNARYSWVSSAYR